MTEQNNPQSGPQPDPGTRPYAQPWDHQPHARYEPIEDGQQHAKPAKPRKKRRVFMWFFLVVQALFLVWVIVGAAQGTGPSHADIVSLCGKGQWQGLFKSYQDCVVHGANGLTAAGDIGKGIGLALVIGLWVAADIILGIGRLVVVFARRSK